MDKMGPFLRWLPFVIWKEVAICQISCQQSPSNNILAFLLGMKYLDRKGQFIESFPIYPFIRKVTALDMAEIYIFFIFSDENCFIIVISHEDLTIPN